MPKVYVVGALIATGGGYMAYHIGRILHKKFGYEFRDVHVYDRGTPLFSYDIPMETIPLSRMETEIGHDDILVANPSFSNFMFGLRLPGTKIMYVQDFRTYSYLDCHFDCYISVTSLVRHFLKNTYAIEAPTIPPFIQLKQMPEVSAWEARPEQSVYLYVKNDSNEHKLARAAIMDDLRHALPGLTITESMGRKFSHGEFMQKLGANRYFLNVCIAEGFGLIPLEAMAMGCTVTGLDGAAGRDYLHFGENALAVPFKDLHNIHGLLAQLLDDPARGKRLALKGMETAQAYSYKHFHDAWVQVLENYARS